MVDEFQKIVVPYSGTYKKIELSKGTWRFELWGVGSGSSYLQNQSPSRGLGAYVSGDIALTHDITIYCYVGGKGGDNQSGGIQGFNGGSKGADDLVNYDCGSGASGGATDIRLKVDDFYSRIIVAGGGGSPGCYSQLSGAGGSGGSIFGINGSSNIQKTRSGGRGGYISINSVFGYGSKGCDGNEAAGSGGGGYFAGYGGESNNDGNVGGGGGGGGSSYVSGCNGCKTLIREQVLGTNRYSSSYHFHNIVMLPGNDETIPIVKHTTINYTPHSDSGLIIITKLSNPLFSSCQQQFDKNHFFSLFCFITICFK